MPGNIIVDEGPWIVNLWDSKFVKDEEVLPPRVVLQSDVFEHDVALIVNGDFATHEDRVAYAEALAKQMNEGIKALKEKDDALSRLQDNPGPTQTR